ncbi:MAG: hypothetical protein U1E67_02450 [Hyphomicrobiales bacterium]
MGDDGSTEQMRLVFNNGGPVTFAIALEDNESDDFCAGNSTGFQTCAVHLVLANRSALMATISPARTAVMISVTFRPLLVI